MTQESPDRDNKKRGMVIAGVVIAALLMGTIAGYVVSGGFGSQEATAPTNPTGTTIPSVTTTTISDDSSVLMTAVEDTHVDSSEPNAVHAGESSLKIENDPDEMISVLIRFLVEGVPEGAEVSQAVLRLTVETPSPSSVQVSTVGGPWDASTLFFDAPPVGELVGEILPGRLEDEVVEVEVTSVITGNGIHDFYLTTEGEDRAEFESIESGGTAPTLEVAWDGLLLIPPSTSSGSPGVTTSTVLPEARGSLSLGSVTPLLHQPFVSP